MVRIVLETRKQTSFRVLTCSKCAVLCPVETVCQNHDLKRCLGVPAGHVGEKEEGVVEYATRVVDVHAVRVTVIMLKITTVRKNVKSNEVFGWNWVWTEYLLPLIYFC